jgi:nucleotidyltransferase/DNA polymerase involved in DNA repair
MPQRIPWSWFRRIEPTLAEQYPSYGEKRIRQIAAGLWWKLQPRGYRYDPETIKAVLKTLDPQELPVPIDFHGFDHTLVRLVPEIDQLIEVQVRLPSHVWEQIREETKGWSDVEVDQKNRRIVRRGRLNKATNIFLDSE